MNTTTETEYVGAQKMVTSDCFAITFVRPTGANPVSVNGYPLEEGQALKIKQNVGDIDRTQYSIVFGTGTGSDACWVFRTLPLERYKRD